jgi:hypothetical protein
MGMTSTKFLQSLTYLSEQVQLAKRNSFPGPPLHVQPAKVVFGMRGAVTKLTIAPFVMAKGGLGHLRNASHPRRFRATRELRCCFHVLTSRGVEVNFELIPVASASSQLGRQASWNYTLSATALEKSWLIDSGCYCLTRQ